MDISNPAFIDAPKSYEYFSAIDNFLGIVFNESCVEVILDHPIHYIILTESTHFGLYWRVNHLILHMISWLHTLSPINYWIFIWSEICCMWILGYDIWCNKYLIASLYLLMSCSLSMKNYNNSHSCKWHPKFSLLNVYCIIFNAWVINVNIRHIIHFNYILSEDKGME